MTHNEIKKKLQSEINLKDGLSDYRLLTFLLVDLELSITEACNFLTKEGYDLKEIKKVYDRKIYFSNRYKNLRMTIN